MADDITSRLSTRRDTLRLGSAIGAALAADAALRGGAVAQEATPTAGGLSMTKQTITLETATALLEAAQEHARGLGAAMNIAVVDESGMLKAFHRMDGNTSAASVDIAQMKAYSAAAFRTPTHQIAEGAADNPQRIASLTNLPRFTLLLGGYPVMDGDAVIGGIGVSGGSPEQDMEVAEAALAAIQQ
jgi:uncharacterized protein GlcG (DUF336 family)